MSANTVFVNDLYHAQVANDRTLEAIIAPSGCTPVVIPGMTAAAATDHWCELLDGLVLTGGRANVHPEIWGGEDDGRHGPFDRGRDGVVLPLVRAMVAAGKPVFGVCRGIQEMNVAFGGTLHPEIRDEPGRMNHRMPPDEKDPAVIFRPRHEIALTPGGRLAAILGEGPVVTNSLHGQALWGLAACMAVEARAGDGTIEAVSVTGARRFALGVQWHAEYEPATDPLHRLLWEAFGAAAAAAQAERQALSAPADAPENAAGDVAGASRRTG
ncbi:MAG: gamma-glutamyl-gamma-aminobutyrate hydrolase family protein [Pseudomonadota bacterium]